MKNTHDGQILLEAIIALAIIVLVLASISIVIVVAVSNSIFGKDQSQASKYAQQGMEIIRNLRNTNLGSFNSHVNLRCLDANGSISIPGAGGCGVNLPSVNFNREAYFDTVTPGECGGSGSTKVTVTVRWASPKCPGGVQFNDRYCHKSVVTSCFSTEPSNL